MSLLRIPIRSVRVLARQSPSSRHSLARPLHSSTTLGFPRKDSQDKDSINTNPTEYSKSGGDPSSAQMDTAFDPNTTSPEGQEKKAAAESGGKADSPLDASPANHELSKPRDEGEGGAERSPNESGNRRKSSGPGSSTKHGGEGGKHPGAGSGGTGGSA